jgi:tetratricopeptide (TPR) repeat protein
LPETDLTLLGGLLAVEEDLARAEPLLRELQASPRPWRELSEAHRNLLLGVPMVEFLRQSSRQARYEDPQKMVQLAESARLLADNLSEDRYGRQVIADFRARAWADVGNAYRVAGDLGAAMLAFRRAAGILDQGTYRFVREIASLLASLLSDLGHFEHAAEILESALELKGSDPEDTIKLLTQLGLVRGYANDPERAVVVLLQALGCLSATSPNWLAVVHALVLNLVDAGHFQAARVLLNSTLSHSRIS